MMARLNIGRASLCGGDPLNTRMVWVGMVKFYRLHAFTLSGFRHFGSP